MFVVHLSRRPCCRRQSASAAVMGGHQPRAQRKQCGLASFGWTTSEPGVKCAACPGEVVHLTTVALCAACHRCFLDGEATHLGLERLQRARVFVQRCQADGVRIPGVVVRNFKPRGDCLCFREDCFHACFLAVDRKVDASRRCSTCNQQNEDGK